MLNPADFASADDYVAAVMAEEDQVAHGDDTTKSVDHAALFDLVPRSGSTHVAVSDGAWSDPSTWHEGRIPDAGAKVLIPEAISVTYDSTSEASLFTVRVDGQVDFATDKNTMMEVDTFVVSTTGRLNIGTEANPVQQGVSAQIVIADNGPIDVLWDPMLLSRGLISHGEVQIHGQEKTSHLKVSTDAMAGDTQLVLEQAPEGWQVGDQLVLTGTHFVPWKWNGTESVYQGTQDEEVVITAIDGNIITLDRPLTYDHDTPRDDLDAYVANYSRNVVVATENADDVPVHQRGHTMFMHSDKIDVRYAEFHELGRTDKSERAVDADQVIDVQSDTNVKGRYAFHLHKTGVDGDHDPSIVTGNTVWGSPGWGFTHHQSNALMENNAAYNTFGAGFVAETGDEIGAWRHNIAIKGEGAGGSNKDGEDVQAFDLARTGVGFWFQGRLVEAEGNVAAGVSHGFVYMHRGSPPNEVIRVLAENLDQPETLRYESSGAINLPAIQHFIDNEVLASAHGLSITKSGSWQNHDVRSVFDGFTAWEVHTGVYAGYTAHYTFTDLDLVATKNPQPPFGIRFDSDTFDIVVNGATVTGFDRGVSLTDAKRAPHDYVFIDLKIEGSRIADMEGYDPAFDQVLTSADLVANRLQLDLAWDGVPLWTWDHETGRVVRIDGEKTDSIGTVLHGVGEQYKIGFPQMSALLSHDGYYTTADGRKIVIVEEYFADRATGEIRKMGIPIQLADAVPLTQVGHWLLDGDAIYRGEIDLNSAAPVTANDTATTVSGTPVVIDVMANDSDPESDALILDGLVQPRHGKVEANADGTVTYTPDRNFAGEESFNYWVTDDNGSYTRATVQVSVAAEGTVEQPVDDGTVNDGTVNDGTVDDGTVDDGTVDDGTVGDGTLEPSPEPVTNTAPVAESDAYATNVRVKISVSAAAGVLHNDVDADGDVLTARVVDGPAGGNLKFNNNDGSFEYNPRGNFSGTDSFTYLASDGQAESGLTTVTITVGSTASAPNQAQTTASDSETVATETTSSESQSLTTSWDGTDTASYDPGSEPISPSSAGDTYDDSSTDGEDSIGSNGAAPAKRSSVTSDAGATGLVRAAAAIASGQGAAREWQDVMPEQILGGAGGDFDWLAWRDLEGLGADSLVSELLELVEALDHDPSAAFDVATPDALQPYAQDFTLV